VPQKHGSLRAFAPKTDRIGQRTNSCHMTSNKTAAEIDPVKSMFFGVHVGNLPDIIGDRIEETPADVFRRESRLLIALLPTFLEDFAEATGDHGRFEA